MKTKMNCVLPRTWLYQNPQHSTFESDRIFQFMEKGQYCDLTIICENERFPVHKVVMAASCDHFELNSDDNSPEMKFDKIKPDMMKKIIDFCYLGKFEFSNEKLEDILFAITTFQLTTVLNACSEFLLTIIDANNCLLIENLAHKYIYTELQERASEYIKFNFEEVFSTETLLEIEIEQLLRLLNFDDLNVSSEYIVLKNVKKWIEHKETERVKHALSLYELIKLPYIPAEILFEESINFCGIKTCKDLILQAIQWQTVEKSRPQLESNRTRQRKKVACILTIGYWDKPASQIEMYDSENNTWSPFMDLKTNARNFNYALLNYDLYIIGGFEESSNLNTVTKYNLLNGTQKTLSPMQESRGRPGVGTVAGLIFVFGGSGAQILNSAEKYDPTIDKWTYIKSMPTAKGEFGCVTFDNEIFVIGGTDATVSSSNSVEAYCPKLNQWRICSTMSVKRYSPGVAKIGRFIYAVGGRTLENATNISSAERYDPKRDVWSFIENLSTPRYGLGLAAMGSNLIAVGGGQGGATMSIVEEYDTSTQKWRQLAPCKSKAHVNLLSVPKKWIDRAKSNM